MSGAGIYVKTPSGLVAAATVPGPSGSQGPQSSLVPGTITTGAAGSSAAATITGPGPVQTLNLTIPKGDPGGFVQSANAGAADLNTMTTAGLYFVSGAHTNAAVAGGSYIEVQRWAADSVTQQQVVSQTARTFRRNLYAGTWYPWVEVTPKGSIGSGDLTGTGSPEGVLTAPVGTYYTDTAITNGAMRWAKKTGTGNTGWKVIEGDTGWRVVTSWNSSGVVTGTALPAGLAPSSNTAGSLQVKRTEGIVQWRVRGVTVSASGNFAYPVGFSAGINYCYRASLTDTLGTFARWGMGSVIFFAVANAVYPKTFDATYYAVWEYETPDAWPTTLPGVAA